MRRCPRTPPARAPPPPPPPPPPLPQPRLDPRVTEPDPDDGPQPGEPRGAEQQARDRRIGIGLLRLRHPPRCHLPFLPHAIRLVRSVRRLREQQMLPV